MVLNKNQKDYQEIMEVLEFATEAHKGQVRKYSGIPYITHPIAVAQMIAEAGGSTAQIKAALLHDVVEDCGVTREEIQEKFGFEIRQLVHELSKVCPVVPGLTRAYCKQKDKEFLATVSPEAQSIKYCDIIHNTVSIIQEDPVFAKVFVQEKRDLIKVMNKGDKVLLAQLTEIIDEFLGEE